MAQLGPLHTDIIQEGKEYFQEIKKESFSKARQRWEASSNNVSNKHTFGFTNFKASSTRLHRYNNMILSMDLD